MNFWSDLKVKSKIVTLILCCCVGMLTIAGFGLFKMSKMRSDLREMKDGLGHVALLQDLKNNFLAIRLDLVYFLSLKDQQKIDEKSADMASRAKFIKEKLQEFEKWDLDDSEKQLALQFREGFERYLAEGTKLAEMSRSANAAGDQAQVEEAVKFAVTTVAPLYEKPAAAIAELVSLNVKEGDEMFKRDEKAYFGAVVGMVVVMVMVLLVAAAIGLLTANSVSRPLNEVFRVLERIANGDLVPRVDVKSKDEMGLLAVQVNRMADELREVIGLVSQNSQQVAAASAQLHATSKEMAEGAEEMAAQATTVSTAGEEMAATAGDIANNCHTAAHGAEQASDAARAGAEVVEKTVDIMNRIAGKVQSTAQTVESLGERSDQIGTIIGTIEDIADQTNLLALNAAIEAARAGEQGRGFAVVADEVRALAERTTKATREIGEMIKAIQSETKGAVVAMEEGVKEVETGMSEAAKSGDALMRILDQISNVAMQVNQIATAAEEQTATTNEMSGNILSINDVVQRTASGANESVIAADQLAKLAEELQDVVTRFKVA
ncbi:methyl-accepting chemotaxis protein [Geobacter sp. DSM 9736]|uniref:methyl-accepting chemotaxis protein n=1 Tax=Geobacter sp. DSM 9736 TaxID=1277350 RepID=UPI000B50FAE5|nr:methyl-accepting chemotaxis protein [Geobacter sp. DSM 9736]SNB46042.1 methyl-accepting chemotaxis protein [Geobacter sp. DSM 9736]